MPRVPIVSDIFETPGTGKRTFDPERVVGELCANEALIEELGQCPTSVLLERITCDGKLLAVSFRPLPSSHAKLVRLGATQVVGGASTLVRKGEQRVLSSKGIVFPVTMSMFPSQDEYHAALGRLLPGVRR